MTTIAPERPETDVAPGYRGFLDVAATVGLKLEPFQRRIARAIFDGRELLILLPRGNGKTCLQALRGLGTPGPGDHRRESGSPLIASGLRFRCDHRDTMPSISYPRLALTNLGFLVRAEISYRVTFSEPEWQMAVAGSNFGAGGFKWRDHFSIYAHDGAQGTRLFDLNGSFLPIYDRDPYRSLNMERSFNLSRFVLNEDLFGADEIRCKIKVFPQISEELLFEEDLTQIVSLPGGFPFLPRWARRKRPPAISSSPPDAEP